MNQSEYETLMMAHDNLQRELSDVKRLMGKAKHELIKANIALNKRVQELEEENKRQREALEEIEEHAVWGMFTNKYVIMARKGLGLLEVEESE